MKYINRKMISRCYILFFACIFFVGCSFRRKVSNNKNEFIEMANHIILKKYNEDFYSLHKYLIIDSLKDVKINKFCKKYKIIEILCQGVGPAKNNYDFLPEDSTIVFIRKFVPIIGPQRDVIIDCKHIKKDYPNHPPSYGWESVKIDTGVYYYKH